MDFRSGLLLCMGLAFAENEENQTPIVNDQPDADVVVPNNDDKTWFDYKHIINGFDEHFTLFMGIIGCIAFIVLILLTTCIVYKCKKCVNEYQYSQQKGYEHEGINDYITETDVEVEKQLI